MSVVPVTGPEKSLWCFPRLILFTFSLFATVSLLCQHPPPLPRLLSLLHPLCSSLSLLVLPGRKKVLTPLCVSFYKPPSLFSLLSPWLCLSVCLPLRPRSFPIIPTYCLLSLSVAPFLCLPPPSTSLLLCLPSAQMDAQPASSLFRELDPWNYLIPSLSNHSGFSWGLDAAQPADREETPPIPPPQWLAPCGHAD